MRFLAIKECGVRCIYFETDSYCRMRCGHTHVEISADNKDWKNKFPLTCKLPEYTASANKGEKDGGVRTEKYPWEDMPHKRK